MIAAAAQLFQRDGYQATSWRRLVDAAGTPWGSAWHHFPGGKEELAVLALELSAQRVTEFVERCFARHDEPADAIEAWFAAAAATLRKSEYRCGCPVATVALEAVPDSQPISAAMRAAMAGWTELVCGELIEAEIAPARARELATMVVIALEGALLVARVSQSVEPLALAGSQLAALLRAEAR